MAAGVLLAMALGTPAEAGTLTEPEPVDSYVDCTDWIPCDGQVSLSVIWLNRTARVQGHIDDLAGDGLSTTVFVEAYAGAKKIAGTTRTASDWESVDFNFVIGDPNLVGGIDRIKLQICWSGAYKCSVPQHAHRNGYEEQLPPYP